MTLLWNLNNDVRYALRQLCKSPGFTATAILSLALGIGATTAVFSVIYAILLDPYPYAAPDRMIHLRLLDSAGKERGFGLTAGQWQELKKSPVVEDAFIDDDWNLEVTGKDVPEDVAALEVSSNMFEFMGVPAALGRGLQRSDAADGHDPQPVLVLSYKFWKRYYNSDPSVIGRTLQLVHKTYTIVGVASPRYTWEDSDVYLPLKIVQDPVRTFGCEVRLKPGVSHDVADAALLPLMQQFARETPKHFPTEAFRVHVAGMNDDFLKQLGGTLSLLFCAVGLLLAIGCGNVSILLLARGTARQQEFAVRSAIGASRRRLVMQLLTESLLLSLTGAGLGVCLAYLSLGKIVATLPQYSFPHEAAIRINVPVLLFSVAVAMLTGVLFGLWPALQISRPDVGQMMQSGTRKIAGSVQGRRTLGTLIGGQIALTLLMLAGAGAALEGFLRLMNTTLGYDPHNIMSVGIPVHENTFKTWAERANYFEALRARVATVPGVRIAAISTNATPPANGRNSTFEILGKAAGKEQTARLNFVSPGYFPALQIGLAEGRIWDETENRNAARVVVINRTLARQFFPKGDAMGSSIKFPLQDSPPFSLAAPGLASAATATTGAVPIGDGAGTAMTLNAAPKSASSSGADGWLRIVGIIDDKRDDGLRNPILPEAFIPYTLWMRMGTQILVKSDVPPLTLLHEIQKQISMVNGDQQTAGGTEDLGQWIKNQPEYAEENLIAWLFGAFAVLALALAAVGLYSVVSYSVAQRTNEFGIRMALGAGRGHVLKIVFASMLGCVGGGVAAGLLLTVLMNKVLTQWAVGSSRDPAVLVAAVLTLTLVAAIACAVPARRAARVDPMAALRYE